MTKLQILGAPQSPLVWAVRIAAAEKGIDAEHISARPHTPEIDAIHPFGKIPSMRHGDVTLGESRAIALYIDGVSPQKPLVPQDLATCARMEQWVMHFYTEYLPVMLAGYIGPYFFPAGPDGKPDRAVIDGALPAMKKAIGTLDRQLAQRDYIVEIFTLADILFGPLLHYASKLPEGAEMIAAAPNVATYLERLSARDGFKATFPPPLPARAAA